MFTRRISAIIGALLALLPRVGTPTAAHATETSHSAAATPSNFCDILPICPRYRRLVRIRTDFEKDMSCD